MEMTYTGALTMPANFAAVSEAEMTYVGGGSWGTYSGWDGILEITQIAGFSYSAGAAAVTALKASGSLAAGSSGAAIIGAIGLALGSSLLLGVSAVDAALCIAAADYFATSWNKTGSFNKAGFKANTVGFFTFGICIGVKPK